MLNLVHMAIDQAVRKALEPIRRKQAAKELNLEDGEVDVEVLAHCELIEIGVLEATTHKKPDVVKWKDKISSHGRLFTVCHMLQEDGTRKQIILVFKQGARKHHRKQDKDKLEEELDMSKLDGDFSPRFHPLTPEEVTVKELQVAMEREGVPRRANFEISFPGAIGQSRYKLKLKHLLHDPEQRKLFDWLEEKARADTPLFVTNATTTANTNIGTTANTNIITQSNSFSDLNNSSSECSFCLHPDTTTSPLTNVTNPITNVTNPTINTEPNVLMGNLTHTNQQEASGFRPDQHPVPPLFAQPAAPSNTKSTQTEEQTHHVF